MFFPPSRRYANIRSPQIPAMWSVPFFVARRQLADSAQWGMAGVINPRDDTPIAAYQAEAKKPGTFVLQPGEDWPSEAENSQTPLGPSSVPTGGSGLPSSSTGPPVQIVTAAAPGVTAVAATSGAAMSVGGIAGVVLGSVAVVALICGLFFFLGRRRRSGSAGHGTPPSVAYKKGQPPVGYITAPPPQQPLYGEAMSYRAYPHDPRAFPPGVLADDKSYNRQSNAGGPPVEIGNPTPGWDPRTASLISGGHTSPVPQSDSGEQPPRRGVGSDSG